MNVSQKCIDLIKLSEGFRSAPYLCPAGIPTIGYGSTRDTDGKPITLNHPPITEQEAYKLCIATLKQYEDAVNRYVKVSLTQNQFDALVDFTYNMGTNALKKSTLLKKLNLGGKVEAANELRNWVYADGKKQKGLITRRDRERTLFLS